MDAHINIASVPPLSTKPTTTSNASELRLFGPLIFTFFLLYRVFGHDDDFGFPMITKGEPKIKYYVKSEYEFDHKYLNDTPAREQVENEIVDEYSV
nr:hypothetical protein [Tanacetum cinerariifolium]